MKMENNQIVKSKIYGENHMELIINGAKVTKESYGLKKLDVNLGENEHMTIDITLEVNEQYGTEWRSHTSISLKNGQTYIPMSIAFDGVYYFTGDRRTAIYKRNDDGGLEISITLKSKSFLMDKIKRFVVYQNPEITYLDIIKEIEAGYSKEAISILGLDEGVGEKLKTKIFKDLIIQYNETDWEFLKRLVSHFGFGVYNSINGSITIGFHQNTTSQKYDNIIGNIWENVDGLKVNKTLSTNEMFSLCDNIVDENDMVIGTICKTKIEYNPNDNKYGSFKCNYLIRNNDYKYKRIQNENVKGICISGKIVRIPLKGITNEGNDYAILTIDFDDGLKEIIEYLNYDEAEEFRSETGGDRISKNNKTRRFRFPYVTPYTTTKTGFYCAPEVNDIVSVYFPTNVESQGFIIGAVRNPKSIRFSNPFVRNYRTTEREREIIEELNKDTEERMHNVDMENAVIGTDRYLYDLVVSQGVSLTMVRDDIREETTTKTLLTHNSLNVTSEKSIKTDTDDLSVKSNNYTEKAKSKTSKISEKKSTFEKKTEKVGSSLTNAKSHQIVVG
jgi:hypothetical protein